MGGWARVACLAFGVSAAAPAAAASSADRAALSAPAGSAALSASAGSAALSVPAGSAALAAPSSAGAPEDGAYPSPTREELDVPAAEGAEPPATLAGKLAGVVGWEFTVPLGSVRSFSANVSPLGLELQLRYWALQQLSLALAGEWVWFGDVRPRTTYEIDHATVRATAYDSMVTSTLRLGAQYYLLSEGLALPYVGPHLGLGWTHYRSETADLELTEEEFSIVYGAEAGVLLPMLGSGPMFLFQIRYTAQPASEFRSLVSNVQTLSFTASVGF